MPEQSERIASMRSLWQKARRKLVRQAINLADDPIEVQALLLERQPFTPETVIRAYQHGFFAIPKEKGGMCWLNPPERGILPIDDFHVEKEVARILRQKRFNVSVDTCFAQVIRACADHKREKLGETWLTEEVLSVACALHRLGVAHSVEIWQGDELVGGVYGIALGSYFSGESQFYKVTNAGKIAMIRLCEILRASRFTLHDSQYNSPYMQRFGGTAIPRAEFLDRLTHALLKPAAFALPADLL
jgi:leucyl/phenylalanyl-tRNA--protein transferase